MSVKKLIPSACALLFIAATLITLFGCSKESAGSSFMPEIADVADFKCVCSTDQETEFVIEDDRAQALFTYLMEQWQKAEETQIDRSQQDCIYLLFQDGEPLLILNQEPNAKFSDAFSSEAHFYGVFWIHENGYMVYSPMPTASRQTYCKLPEGTYETIAQLLQE